MSLTKIIVGLLVLMTGALVTSTDSFAGKPEKCTPWPECNDDGGDPPPPPDGCNDTFPAFAYSQPGTRRIPGETRLASSEGCRTEPVMVPAINARMHMTEDGTAGVFVSSGGREQYSVRRQDFTVDPSGVLDVKEAVTITLPGVLPGDGLHYEVHDIWGDANHDSLYIAVMRIREFSTGPNARSSTREFLIYNLKNLDDNRTIYRQLNTPSEITNPDNPPVSAKWLDDANPESITLQDCDTVPYPRFSPICYGTGDMRFNPSGTRLYLEQGIWWYLQDPEVNLWQSTMRLNINKPKDDDGNELPLADWIISGPEMVAVTDHRGSAALGGAIPRPGGERYTLPDPEIVAAGDQFYDADQCVGEYADFADGNIPDGRTLLADNHWQLCITDGLFANGTGPGSWDSPNSYLTGRRAQQGKNNMEIYRIQVLVEPGTAGTEELLIVNGKDPDTGM